LVQSNQALALTAFLDVLGFGDRVLKARNSSDVRAIVKDVRKIQSEFEFRPRDEPTKVAHSNYKKTVLAFSDSIVVNVPLVSTMTKLEGTFDPLMSELSAMALAQGRCAAVGLFLRGGVDLGWWYRRGDTLVSQSMVRAYRAENRANVPVIALTSELYRFLSRHDDRDHYGPEAAPLRQIIRRYRETVAGQPVTFWFLDYVAICAESVGWITSRAQHREYLAATPNDRKQIMEDGYKANLDAWFTCHARTIERAHKGSRSASVKGKYEWLADYHNKIVPRFTSSPGCLCQP
jgi:hypothetical protein